MTTSAPKLVKWETRSNVWDFSRTMFQVWQVDGMEWVEEVTIPDRAYGNTSFDEAVQQGLEQLRARLPKPAPRKQTAYLSGPMTGMPDLNFPAFNAAAAKLRKDGLTIVNPAELNPDPTTPWAQCMRTDIKALCDCDAIMMLDGWEKSKGAHLELQLAHRLELDILFYRDWSL